MKAHKVRLTFCFGPVDRFLTYFHSGSPDITTERADQPSEPCTANRKFPHITEEIIHEGLKTVESESPNSDIESEMPDKEVKELC